MNVAGSGDDKPYPIVTRKECRLTEHRETCHSDDDARPGVWFVPRVPESLAVSTSTVDLSDFCPLWTKAILNRCLGIALLLCNLHRGTGDELMRRRV